MSAANRAAANRAVACPPQPWLLSSAIDNVVNGYSRLRVIGDVEVELLDLEANGLKDHV